MIIGKDAKEGDRQTTGIGNAEDPLPTLQSAHHHAVAYGINPQNGSMMVPCTKEVGQTNAVGHENGVAIAYDGYNQTAHDECTFPLRTANGSEGDDRTVKVAIGFDPSPRECLKRQFGELQTTLQNGTCPGHHNAVAIRTANSIVEGAHGVTLQDESATTLQSGGGKAGQGECVICVRTANTHANGQAVAIGVDPYNSASTGDVSKTLNTAVAQDTDHTGAVAIGIGRDAFNSGKNAQMAQSFSTEVQPPITAKGSGGVCTNGEPRTGRM